MRGNTSLEEFSFDNVHDVNAMEILLSALSETYVSFLSLRSTRSRNLIGSAGATIVAAHLNYVPSLVKLNISHCNIGPSGAICLSAAIATNTSLRVVFLCNNNIRDEGAIAIANLLEQNSTLELVTLDNNEISNPGKDALLRCVYDPSSLDTLKRSNHTLQSMFTKPRGVFGPAHLGSVLFALAANVRSLHGAEAATRKIARRLHKKHRIRLGFELFEETNVGFMPTVLAWIGNNCDLGTQFDVMRQWNMPVLYENTTKERAD